VRFRQGSAPSSAPSLVIAAKTVCDRVLKKYAGNNDAKPIKRLAAAEIADDADLTSDGHERYSAKSLGECKHAVFVETKA
jgi:hypothetical protein